jgi:hypothetical protein
MTAILATKELYPLGVEIVGIRIRYLSGNPCSESGGRALREIALGINGPNEFSHQLR